jgi:hypothetical protein
MILLLEWLTECPEFQFVANDDFSTQRKTPVSPSTSAVTESTGKPHGQQMDSERVPESPSVLPTGDSQDQAEDRGHPFQRKDDQNPEMAALEDNEDSTYRDLSSDLPQTRASLEIGSSWPLTGRSTLSGDEISLLKFYGCRVAPWVSLLSLKSPYGTDCAESEPVSLHSWTFMIKAKPSAM